MARKLMISEVFKDAKKEVVSNVRLSDTLYKLITKDAKDQGVSISELVRDLLGFHYLLEHLKTKLENGSDIEAGEITILETFRAHVSQISNTLSEVDDIRRSYADQRSKDFRQSLGIRGDFEDRQAIIEQELRKKYGSLRVLATWSDRIVFKSKDGVFEVGYSIDGEMIRLSEPLELETALFPKGEAETIKKFFGLKKSFRDFKRELLKKESGKKGGSKQ